MARVTLSIPPELMKAAGSKLGGGGAERVKEYLLCSLHCLAQDKELLSPETIRLLMDGLSSPPVRVSNDYWEKKIRRYRQRNRSGNSSRGA